MIRLPEEPGDHAYAEVKSFEEEEADEQHGDEYEP